MNSTAWLHHFESNRLNRLEPHWELPCREDAGTAAKLARSLSHFQLGESGEGNFLLARGQRAYPDDPDYVAALGLFVAEEQEHARLLEHLVARFGGTLVPRHWSHACFRLLRRALGVQFEIQTLVIAELIGTAYYQVLHHHTRDRVLVEVCELMLGDEAAHLEFHAHRFAAWQWHWLPLARGLWSTQFQLLFLAATGAAWFDHRGALTAVGVTRREYSRRTRRECAMFLHALSRPGIPAGSTSPPSALRKEDATVL